MGYTHYWNRSESEKEISTETFGKITADVKKIFERCEKELGIRLANGHAEKNSQPIADENLICFNGSDEQPIGIWTTDTQVIIPWPDDNAGITEPEADPVAEKTSGAWFFGHLLTQRVAPIDNLTGLGRGSYEPFYLPRVIEKDAFLYEGKYYYSCKTAYRPYDLTVTAALISIKRHYPKLFVGSDGKLKDWMDGMLLCRKLFGYGMDFKLERE